jgi:cytochrome P450
MPRLLGGRLPPGPPLPAPLQTLLIWRSPLQFLERCRRRYGPAFTVRITSHPPLVFLCDPAEVRALLAAPAEVLHPGEGANTIEPLVGSRSFMLCDGEEHLSGRRIVLPPFRSSAVDDHAGLIADVVVKHLATWPQGVPFALAPRLRALTLETLLRIIFAGGQGPDDVRLRELHHRLLRMLNVTASAVLPEPLLRSGPGRATWARFLDQRADVDALLHAIIEDRGRAGSCSRDLLDRLREARGIEGSPLTCREVRDNLMSIVLAGHETTASQLAWAFQLLAHNPRVLARLLEELEDHRGGEEYLVATIKEVQRHRPVFLFAIPRAVKAPIEIGEWTYTPPAQLLACIYLVHHDPALYPDPEEFRPERFLHSPPRRSTWLAWGGGRKRCPGQHLATLEMKTVLRTVLRNMTVLPVAKRIERPRWRSVIVTPHTGSRIVLYPRN